MRAALAIAAIALGACLGHIGDGSESSELTCADGSPFDPGPVYLRRLTNSEYRETVALLLGRDASDVTAEFPPDSIARGYSNNSESIAISDLHVERYEQAAERLAFEATEDPASRDALLGCDILADGCLASFIARFGRRAFRRPLDAAERGAFLALAAEASDDPDRFAAMRLVIQGALQAPSFLFRIERGAPEGHLMKLSGFEVATRLSFLLVGRGPDDGLLDAAERGELDDAAGVRQWAETLYDAGANARQRFAREWLQLGLLETAEPMHPLWSETLRASMLEETERFAADLMNRDDASMLDLLDARRSFIDDDLAVLYGLDAPSAPFAELAYPEGSPRAGLLTQASVLTLTAKNEAATAIRRGKYVRDVLLCDPPPPPPPDVPPLVAEDGQSAQDQLNAHLADPVCQTCHERLDPLGLGFARYDAIGAYRTEDESGASIEQQGRAVGLEPEAFDGALELAARLRAAPEVEACMVTHAFRFAFGRGEHAADGCSLDMLGAAFAASGHSFRRLMLAFVESPAFRYRSARDADSY